MPDISKCSNHKCPLAKKCFRHECEPNDFWQAYTSFTPLQDDNGKVTCEYFIELR